MTSSNDTQNEWKKLVRRLKTYLDKKEGELRKHLALKQTALLRAVAEKKIHTEVIFRNYTEMLEIHLQLCNNKKLKSLNSLA